MVGEVHWHILTWMIAGRVSGPDPRSLSGSRMATSIQSSGEE